MKYMFKEIPRGERPRERLLKHGANTLADYELLAIILRTGTKDISVLDVAREITMKFNTLAMINEATIPELKTIKGVGEAKAIEILAVAELGRRINTPSNIGELITSPLKSYQYLKEKLQHLSQETIVCLFLNVKNQVISERTIAIGTLDQTIFHPRDIIKWALKYSAYGIILAHNHPSGEPTPSNADIKMTDIIIEAAKIVGLVFVDHIIIGKNKYYSFVERKVSTNK